MKRFVKVCGLAIAPIVDIILVPLTLVSSLWFKYVRTVGLKIMRCSRWIFNTVGVLPIRNHYYEPKFIFKEEVTASPKARVLRGVAVLKNFNGRRT